MKSRMISTKPNSAPATVVSADLRGDFRLPNALATGIAPNASSAYMKCSSLCGCAPPRNMPNPLAAVTPSSSSTIPAMRGRQRARLLLEERAPARLQPSQRHHHGTGERKEPVECTDHVLVF